MSKEHLARTQLRRANFIISGFLLLASKVYAMSLSAVAQVEPVQVETLPSKESTLTKKQKIIDVIVCCCLVLFGGLMSGLTIGLASIDRLSLEVDSIGNPKVT